MKYKDFEIGKEYKFIDIIDFGDNYKDYGPEYIGENAIHIPYNNKDMWFILTTANTSGYYYRLVFNE